MKTNRVSVGLRPVNSVSTIVFIAALAFGPRAGSAIIWDGPPITFTNVAGSDPAQPANQDRLTADVWLTRGGSAGLFNAAFETSYAHFFSPSNTEWAYGELTNYAALTYTSWEGMFGGSTGGGPSATIGQDTVVHLISDDIYLAVRLTSWGVRTGGFSYIRSTPHDTPPPPPAPVLTGAFPPGTNAFQLTFAGTPGFPDIPGYTFTVLGTTNLFLEATNWTVLGAATDAPPGSGQYQFNDPGAGTNQAQRFYLLRWP